jgi:hypothetical protein
VAILPEHPATRGFLYWQPDEPARLEVDVVRRTDRQAEMLLSLRNEDLDGAMLTEPTLEIREGGSGRTIAREQFESLAHFRDWGLRAVVDGFDPSADLHYLATYRDGDGTLRHVRRTLPTRQGGRRP